jgi:hypothetical protein
MSINEFTTKSFFLIADIPNNEILETLINGDPYWNYNHYNPSDECRYKTREEAQSVIARLSVAYPHNEFEVQERFIGNDLYEEIREALNLCYGDTLWEYESDHAMTAAVMRVLKKRRTQLLVRLDKAADKTFGL